MSEPGKTDHFPAQRPFVTERHHAIYDLPFLKTRPPIFDETLKESVRKSANLTRTGKESFRLGKNLSNWERILRLTRERIFPYGKNFAHSERFFLLGSHRLPRLVVPAKLRRSEAEDHPSGHLSPSATVFSRSACF